MPSCLSALAASLRRGSHSAPSASQPRTQPVAQRDEKAALASACHQMTAPHAACCDFSPLPAYAPPTEPTPLEGEMAAVARELEKNIAALDGELRDLSLKMWDLHELGWEEFKTHDLFVKYLSGKKGWKVTPHAHGLETAFRAEFVHAPAGVSKSDVPCVGFCSELDALPGIGHACGHNLIAIAGVAAALSLAELLVARDQPGKVVLLGTPSEEKDGGKINMLEAGAFEGMDASLMVHPTPTNTIGSFLAVVPVEVKYEGKTAHSGIAPWEGINALDAAVLAYNNISALRQQIKPNCRVHGILSGGDQWAPNIVPSHSVLLYNVRAPSVAELETLQARVEKCFRAAALATGCEVSVKWGATYYDTRNSAPLSRAYRGIVKGMYGYDVDENPVSGSTDMGNVTYAMPAIHPCYAIKLANPTGDANHTVGFAAAAKTPEAHERTKEAATGIAAAAARVLLDEAFRREVHEEFDEWKKGQQALC